MAPWSFLLICIDDLNNVEADEEVLIAEAAHLEHVGANDSVMSKDLPHEVTSSMVDFVI